MSAAANAVYRLAVLTGWTGKRRRHQAGAAVFCFHNVVDTVEGVGDRSLHVSRASFGAYLDWIETTYAAVVPLLEIVSRVDRGESVSELAALTFDDACVGFFAHALPELRKRRLPSTTYVVPEAADQPQPFWWDRLALAGLLSNDRRDHLLSELRGDQSAILAAYPEYSATDIGPDLLPASWSRIAAALGPDLEIGSHSLRHRHLTTLTEGELQADLRESKRRIAERLGRDPQSVSYPYGGFSGTVAKIAREAGYRAGVTLTRDVVRPGGDFLTIPRINVPAGISVPALECRAAGFSLRSG